MKSKKDLIGRRIRALRQAMKMTQKDFSRLIDISENALGKIERGINAPNIETLFKIEAKCKTPVETLVSTKEERSVETDGDGLSEYIAFLKTRSPEEIRFLHQIATRIIRTDRSSKKPDQKIMLVISGECLKVSPIKSD